MAEANGAPRTAVDPLTTDLELHLTPCADDEAMCEAVIQTPDGVTYRHAVRWPRKAARAMLYALWQQLQASDSARG